MASLARASPWARHHATALRACLNPLGRGAVVLIRGPTIPHGRACRPHPAPHRIAPCAVFQPQRSTHSAAQADEHPAKTAWQRGKLGFGFSAGGLLFSYFTGAVESLAAAGMLRPGSQIAGSSAGALVAAAVNSGLPPREMLQLCIDMVADCRANGTMHRLGSVLEAQLQAHLPPDAHERCSGCTHVYVTRLFPTVKSVVQSEFGSRDELISALLTSCHIPVYFNGKMATFYQDGWYADGALLQPLPAPPAGAGGGVDYTVKICCFPTQLLTTYFEGIDISIAPVEEEEFSHQLWEYFGWAVLPSSEAEVRRLYEKGRRDAAAWARVVATGQAQVQGTSGAGTGTGGVPGVVAGAGAAAAAAGGLVAGAVAGAQGGNGVPAAAAVGPGIVQVNGQSWKEAPGTVADSCASQAKS